MQIGLFVLTRAATLILPPSNKEPSGCLRTRVCCCPGCFLALIHPLTRLPDRPADLKQIRAGLCESYPQFAEQSPARIRQHTQKKAPLNYRARGMSFRLNLENACSFNHGELIKKKRNSRWFAERSNVEAIGLCKRLMKLYRYGHRPVFYSYSRILVCSSPEIAQVDHCAAHSTYKVKDVRARSILIRPRSRRASAEVE